MKTTYTHLLFDLDGTLTDPMEGITRSVQYSLRHFGIEVTDLRSLTPFIGPPTPPATISNGTCLPNGSGRWRVTHRAQAPKAATTPGCGCCGA